MHTPTCHRTLFDYESAGARMLRLIEIHAPRLMRIGGGALSGEGYFRGNTKRPKLVSSIDQRKEVAGLIQEGRLTASEIAVKVGVYNQLVHRMAKRAGVKLPDGRAVNRMQPCV